MLFSFAHSVIQQALDWPCLALGEMKYINTHGAMRGQGYDCTGGCFLVGSLVGEGGAQEVDSPQLGTRVKWHVQCDLL